MRKIVDTYVIGAEPIRGGRCEKWWQSNPNNLNSAKNKKHRSEDVPGLDIHKFLNEFNLKGVEFGNWLQQGERYDHLLAAGYALYELSKLIGKNIGFDYNVGIAFGARGVRGAAAHFEPLANMINLTKKKGHGVLAHEFAHALDYNIGSYLDQNKKYACLSGGHSMAKNLKDNVGKELRAYVNQIVDFICTTNSYKKLHALTPNDTYWRNRAELFARFFEQYVAYKTKSTNKYLCRSFDWYVSSKLYYRKYIRVPEAHLQEDEFMQILPVADKLVARIKDYCSEDGLPLKVTPYLESIVYKPKTEAKPAAQKQTQDTKATKNKKSAISIEIKEAVMDRLMRIIEEGNNGLFSQYEESVKTARVLYKNKITIVYNAGKGVVKQDGSTIATITGNYAKRKVNGGYKELKPTVTYL